MTARIVYAGALRTTATHLRSGAALHTDAPVDNQGKGESFSPTDLVAVALGSCILTIMGIKARDRALDMAGTTVSVTKEMTGPPRRIGRLAVHIQAKGGPFGEADRKVLLTAVRACPVSRSLHPDLQLDIDIKWPE